MLDLSQGKLREIILNEYTDEYCMDEMGDLLTDLQVELDEMAALIESMGITTLENLRYVANRLREISGALD